MSGLDGALLQMIAALAAHADGGEERLPSEDYSAEKGFTWVDCLRSIDCDAEDKEAHCVHSCMGTLVTKQVITADDECELCLRMLEMDGEEGKPISWGVVPEVPKGCRNLPIGHKDFANSIGACCRKDAGVVMHNGEAQGTQVQLLGIQDGEMVKIKVKKGAHVSFHKGPIEFQSFTVGGAGKFRLAISLCSKGQRVRIVTGEGDSGAGGGGLEGLALLAALAQLVEGVGGGSDSAAKKLPIESYQVATGFKWVDILKAVDCDERKKVAVCVASSVSTMVTAQVLTTDDSCDLYLRFDNVSGEENKSIAFGIVNDVPLHFENKTVGDDGFPCSIGAVCGKEEGAIVHEGKKVQSIPGVKNGDIVKIEVRKGSQVTFLKGTTRLHGCRVGGNGKFRLGVTLCSKGQQVEILDVVNRPETAPSTQLLKADCEVQLPPESDPRLKSMRTKYATGMASHCGRVGRVVRVSQRCARISVDGREFWWDIEVFPKSITRCCHANGCDLKDDTVTGTGRVCDVCRVRLPVGSVTKACRTHDYDVCRYCQGHIDVPEAGKQVIRGPTWKWEEQDGEPYTEGKCLGNADQHGWLTVEWSNGKKYRYRATDHYQDVWLARSNGLRGQKPLPKEESTRQQLEGLLEAVKKLAEGTSQALPKHSYTASQGFTFAQATTSDLKLDDGKKDAIAVGEHRGSLVTEQVLDSTASPVTFQLRIKALPFGAKGLFSWGLCTEAAPNYHKRFPGHSEFKGSIGGFVTPDLQCVLHDNDAKCTLPQVSPGDVVGIRLGNRKIQFTHQGKVVHDCGVVGGKFRFAVCLGSKGQHVSIVSESESIGDVASHVVGANIRVVEVGSGEKQLQYDESTMIGEGGFGCVYKGKLSATPVIVKVLKREAMSEKLQESFENEVRVLAAYQHPHLVLFLGMNPERHLIITEYCVHGDLENYLQKGKGLMASSDERRQLMLEAAQGMDYLACCDLVHRDLKPQNVFVTRGPQAKIGDFGLAAPLAVCQEEAKRGYAGTLTYIAPEVFQGKISAKSDVYSFSMVLGFTFGMEQLDPGKFTNIDKVAILAQLMHEPALIHGHIVNAIKEGRRPILPDSMPAQIKELVRRSWDVEPDRRPVFATLCEHLEQPLAIEHCRDSPLLVHRMQREAEDRARRAETAQLEVELKSRLDEANRLMAAAEAAQKAADEARRKADQKRCTCTLM
mmetsp:Transcript_12580/g.28462  ORF Transcript_12580/g.28462 Transcript_12580/m.28462 type:complete len:1193 (+) Transcript_12580:71-3649(+)